MGVGGKMWSGSFFEVSLSYIEWILEFDTREETMEYTMLGENL